ncbi:MAG: DUF1800 domain-containing protein [Thermoanaerobaculia bacterium]|nr:DUF1800 domain-containing protein [Thermoanaerobaculia bacterium]
MDRRSFLGALGVVGAGGGAVGAMAGAPAASAASGSRTMRPLQVPGKVGEPALPLVAVIALNRMGFGPRPADFTAFQALGSSAEARLLAYVDQQLDPASIVDTDFTARLAAAGYESTNPGLSLDAYLARLWSWYENDNAPSGNTSSSLVRDEAIRLKFLRAIYSRKQLLELLTDFWHDHFNVFIDDSSVVRTTFPHLDEVIRSEALGNFRVLLEGVTKSPAMLYYLDNYTSSNAGPNENFCRELFELHTLGAAAYLGIQQQSSVPTDGNGVPVGYVDADVFEATRAFTGWSFSYGPEGDGDTGLFHYRPTWHDRFQKQVLGVFLPQDQADMKDGHDVLDALAAHPATGQHIATKLCRRLISDDPPQSLIDSAAQLFTDEWQASDQLAQVVRHILLAPEFKSTWGEKIKRPFEIAVSAFRATGGNLSFAREDSAVNSFLWRFDDTGNEPFHWHAPNGFPDHKTPWLSMTPRVMSWRLCGYLIDAEQANDQPIIDALGQTPGWARSTNELVDYWTERILGRPMEMIDRLQIVQFMSQGINPDLDLNLNDEDTADRLRSMIGLIFMSPDFLWR